jgi:hypothetical protein
MFQLARVEPLCLPSFHHLFVVVDSCTSVELAENLLLTGTAGAKPLDHFNGNEASAEKFGEAKLCMRNFG